MLSERQKRIAAMRQFELQMPKYPLKILERLTNFRYRLFEEDKEVEMLATTLASSWDFYEHRLNLSKHGFSLIICSRHNAAVPVYALELSTMMLYEPAAVPDKAADRTKPIEEGQRRRRTSDEQKILISQIILGASAGMTELETMKDRTRQYYLQLKKSTCSQR